MIVSKSKKKEKRIEIDLSGPQGNAYCLMGAARRLARDLGKDEEGIVGKMMEGNYENLLAIFEKEFGDYVVMYR